MKRRFVSLVLLFVAAASAVLASPQQKPLTSKGDGPYFIVDYINFRGKENRTYLEFYVQVQFNELQFIKHASGFRAEYQLTFEILDETGSFVDGRSLRDVADVGTFAETLAMERARTSLFAFTVEPGVYQIKAQITDVETRHSSTVEDLVQTDNYKTRGLTLSDIQFSRKILPATEPDAYVKNKRYIEPNPRRIFAPGIPQNFYAYFEVYNLDHPRNREKATYTTLYIFRNAKGDTVREIRRTSVKPGLSSAHSVQLPIEQFSGGIYHLTVRIRDDDTAQTSEATSSFTIVKHALSRTTAQTR